METTKKSKITNRNKSLKKNPTKMIGNFKNKKLRNTIRKKNIKQYIVSTLGELGELAIDDLALLI